MLLRIDIFEEWLERKACAMEPEATCEMVTLHALSDFYCSLFYFFLASFASGSASWRIPYFYELVVGPKEVKIHFFQLTQGALLIKEAYKIIHPNTIH
jgi:hypothetical protein